MTTDTTRTSTRKLSAAMTHVLDAMMSGKTLRYNWVNCQWLLLRDGKWTDDVNKGTANALIERGLIRFSVVEQSKRIFVLTPAGRAAATAPAVSNLAAAADDVLVSEKASDIMTVTIPPCEEHGGFGALTVKIAATCPVCGGPRGDIFDALSYDGSRRMVVSGWHNPCGHVDLYKDVRNEARTNGLNTSEAQ